MYDENKAWNDFVKTGSVMDYLSYCDVKNRERAGKGARNAADYRRGNSEGKEYKR